MNLLNKTTMLYAVFTIAASFEQLVWAAEEKVNNWNLDKTTRSMHKNYTDGPTPVRRLAVQNLSRAHRRNKFHNVIGYLQVEKFSKAEEIFASLDSKSQSTPDYHFLYGVYCDAKGFNKDSSENKEMAKNSYRKAYDAGSKPIRYKAAFNMGGVFFEAGDMMAAMAWYQHASAVFKSKAHAHIMLGVIDDVLGYKENRDISYSRASKCVNKEELKELFGLVKATKRKNYKAYRLL